MFWLTIKIIFFLRLVQMLAEVGPGWDRLGWKWSQYLTVTKFLEDFDAFLTGHYGKSLRRLILGVGGMIL